MREIDESAGKRSVASLRPSPTLSQRKCQRVSLMSDIEICAHVSPRSCPKERCFHGGEQYLRRVAASHLRGGAKRMASRGSHPPSFIGSGDLIPIKLLLL